MQVVEPGALPAATAWTRSGETVLTPAIITGGAGPAAQRVIYATTDGRVRIRALDSGDEIGGAVVTDAPLADPGSAFGNRVGFVSSSTETEPGMTFVVHNEGGGIDIARFDERSGLRVEGDVALPDSLGCSVAGSPLLTPPAVDGTRFLTFTIVGTCPRGPSLVRVGIGPDPSGPVGTASSTTIPGLRPGVDPVLVVVGSPPRFAVAVARTNGLDLRRAEDGSLEGAVELGENPVAITAPDTAPFSTPALVVATPTRVVRVDQTAVGTLLAGPTAAVTSAPRGLALAGPEEPRVVVATGTGLLVLRAADLSTAASVGGDVTGVSAAGDLAFAAIGGRLVAVRLADASVVDLGAAPGGFAPALARGYVTPGPAALRTTDVTSPSVAMPADASGLKVLSAIASDDRGVAGVVFRLGSRKLVAADAPVQGSRFAPGARYEASYVPRTVPPGSYRLAAIVRDEAGNTGRAQRPVHIGCQRTRRGTRRADVLRGVRGRDCLYGGAGADQLLARDDSPDAVACGRGRDVVRADRYDRVAHDCEVVRRR